MANVKEIVAEDVGKSIAIGQSVFDKASKHIGTVDQVDTATGYFSFEVLPLPEKRDNPFAEKALYVPFRLITNIDPRELYLSVSRDELVRDYSNPPPRTTVVVEEPGGQIATTTEPSGYDGLPVVVTHVNLDELKGRIAVGDHVYTSETTDLGKIDTYDPVTGWMLVEKGALDSKRYLMVPVSLVSDVNKETHEVYLVASGADLQSMQHLEPAYVVFVDANVPKST